MLPSVTVTAVIIQLHDRSAAMWTNQKIGGVVSHSFTQWLTDLFCSLLYISSWAQVWIEAGNGSDNDGEKLMGSYCSLNCQLPYLRPRIASHPRQYETEFVRIKSNTHSINVFHHSLESFLNAYSNPQPKTLFGNDKWFWPATGDQGELHKGCRCHSE